MSFLIISSIIIPRIKCKSYSIWKRLILATDRDTTEMHNSWMTHPNWHICNATPAPKDHRRGCQQEDTSCSILSLDKIEKMHPWNLRNIVASTKQASWTSVTWKLHMVLFQDEKLLSVNGCWERKKFLPSTTCSF